MPKYVNLFTCSLVAVSSSEEFQCVPSLISDSAGYHFWMLESPSRLCLVVDATDHMWSPEVCGSVPCSSGHPPGKEREGGREVAFILGPSFGMGPTAIARSFSCDYCGKTMGSLCSVSL